MPNSMFKHVRISGINVVFPSRKIQIDDEKNFYMEDPRKLDRIKKILGLGTRYVVDEGTTSADLSEEAAKRLLSGLGVRMDELDAVIMASSSQEYIGSSDAMLIHGRLGLPETCAAFDIGGHSCAAYVHGLWTAHSMIESGAVRKCLLLAGDMNSTHSDRRNRISNMLYSDSGSATLLEYSEEENPSYFHLGARGRDFDKIIRPAGGSRLPIREDIAGMEVIDRNQNAWHLCDELLKGMDVFQFTMEKAPETIRTILAYSGCFPDDVDFYAFHLANEQIVKNIIRHAGIPLEKTCPQTFSRYANSGAGSVLSNLCDAKSGENPETVMLVTFGVGLAWGTALLNMKKTRIEEIGFYEEREDRPSRQEMIEQWIRSFKGDV